jgi:hypothetical protein
MQTPSEKALALQIAREVWKPPAAAGVGLLIGLLIGQGGGGKLLFGLTLGAAGFFGVGELYTRPRTKRLAAQLQAIRSHS